MTRIQLTAWKIQRDGTLCVQQIVEFGSGACKMSVRQWRRHLERCGATYVERCNV